MRHGATGSRGSVENGGGGCRRGGGRLPCRHAHGRGAAVGELQVDGSSIAISVHFRRGWGSKCDHDGQEITSAALGKQRNMNLGANVCKICDAMARGAPCLESVQHSGLVYATQAHKNNNKWWLAGGGGRARMQQTGTGGGGGRRLPKYKAEAGIDLGQTKRAKASQRFSKKSWRFGSPFQLWAEGSSIAVEAESRVNFQRCGRRIRALYSLPLPRQARQPRSRSGFMLWKTANSSRAEGATMNWRL